MNYEDKSDHEINMAVTCIENNCQGWPTTASNMGFYHCGVDGGGFYEVEIVDYCNNPSVAWPIIEIMWERLMQVDSYWQAHTRWEAYCIEHDVGKLRAAMILFLKTKDESNE